MSVIEFPYSVYKGIKIPIIPVKIYLAKEELEIAVFVDSGATYTIIRAEEIKDMGFNFKKGKLKMIQVGDGSFIPVYLHNLRIEIGKKEILATIGFSERLGIEFNILGRKGVFKEFRVCFSDKKEKVTFYKE